MQKRVTGSTSHFSSALGITLSEPNASCLAEDHATAVLSEGRVTLHMLTEAQRVHPTF